MQPSFNTRLMSFLNEIIVGGQVRYCGYGRHFFCPVRALRPKVLSRSSYPHYAVNDPKFSAAFYSVGFEGFIEPSREGSQPITVIAEVFYGQTNLNVMSRCVVIILQTERVDCLSRTQKTCFGQSENRAPC